MKDATESPQSACVLVVDDEAIIRDTVTLNLQREGMRVVQAATGPDALAKITEIRPDAVVLDIMLPGMDGLDVCRKIRERSAVPILLLSARGEEIDRVLGLELGADDYLTKPFAMRELVARVRAMLRRVKMVQNPENVGSSAYGPLTTQATPAVVAGDLSIDVATRQVFLGGQALALKAKEFDLLLYLARHPGIVMTRDALLREVWGYQHRVDTRTVDVHIRWLRQKLETDAALPTRLLTVRGHGYRLVVTDEST